jgi:hypothetical protein
MDNQFRYKTKQKVPEYSPGEAERGPIMTVLEVVQTIPVFELHLAAKVLFIEYFHWNPSSTTVSEAITLLMKVEIIFHWTTW